VECDLPHDRHTNHESHISCDRGPERHETMITTGTATMNVTEDITAVIATTAGATPYTSFTPSDKYYVCTVTKYPLAKPTAAAASPSPRVSQSQSDTTQLSLSSDMQPEGSGFNQSPHRQSNHQDHQQGRDRVKFCPRQPSARRRIILHLSRSKRDAASRSSGVMCSTLPMQGNTE
jgi:hypothetical protein